MNRAKRDPSLRNGGKVIFQKEVPLTVTMKDNEPTQLAAKFKFIQVQSARRLSELRIELSTDSDVFMLFTTSITEDNFRSWQQQESLQIPFCELADTLIEMLTNKGHKPDEFHVVFTCDSDFHGVLSFRQTLKFKDIDVCSLEFSAASNEYVRDQLQFTYTELLDELNSTRAELKNLYSMLKIKNPRAFARLRSQK